MPPQTLLWIAVGFLALMALGRRGGMARVGAGGLLPSTTPAPSFPSLPGIAPSPPPAPEFLMPAFPLEGACFLTDPATNEIIELSEWSPPFCPPALGVPGSFSYPDILRPQPVTWPAQPIPISEILRERLP